MRRTQRGKGVQREGGIQGPFQETRASGRDMGGGWLRAVNGVPEFSSAQSSFWEVAGSSRP